MRVPHTIGWGIALALATAVISGFSVYLNGRVVKLFDDPTLLAAVRNGLVGLALVGIAVGAGNLPAIRRHRTPRAAEQVADAGCLSRPEGDREPRGTLRHVTRSAGPIGSVPARARGISLPSGGSTDD